MYRRTKSTTTCRLWATIWAATIFCFNYPLPVQASPDVDLLSRHPAPGRLIDIGGRRLHLHCVGEGPGPTVIIETGAAAPSVLYWQVQNGIAAFARVCAYDRAGLGWSDPAPTGRTFDDLTSDFERLLSQAGVPGPYLIVAHSMGGLPARIYAQRHPEMIAAVVLIDASEEEWSSASTGDAEVAAQLGRLLTAAEAGMTEIVASALPIPANAPPSAELIRRPDAIRAGQDELLAFGRMTQAGRWGELGDLGDTPLIVLSRGRTAEPPSQRDLDWRTAQTRLLRLSTRSEHVIAHSSGHSIHIDEPEAIVEAVRRLHATLTKPPR